MSLPPSDRPRNPVFCAKSVSKLVADLLGELASKPETLEASMLRHLQAIESIEGQLSADDLAPAKTIALVALAHETINEIQRLHLRDEMRRIYVKTHT